ncbi:MAG: translation initiation factor IF-2 [Candidatus Omnitrophica bacterium]|nr:translation initiation factor IF-2 [Candidatus Omnitrophota bacterium]
MLKAKKGKVIVKKVVKPKITTQRRVLAHPIEPGTTQRRVLAHPIEPGTTQKRVLAHQVEPGKIGIKAKKVVSKLHLAKPKAVVKPLKHKAVIKKAKEEIKPQAKPVVMHEHKAEVKIEVKHVIQPEPKIEVKPEHRPEIKIAVLKPTVVLQPVAEAVVVPGKEIELELPVTVKELAVKLQEKSSVIIKHLMSMGVMAGINQALDEIVANKVCLKYGCVIKKAPDAEEIALQLHREKDKASQLKSRPAVVTFMGHVDHGKTSLLDAIRKTKVAEGEHGGITQHIGAYRVRLPGGDITFLDTPGHEAFTAMRARGASITDIVVLVVAADDGIMPQTQEAIDHARAAGVSIIVAINKIDKSGANLDMVKKQLSEAGLVAEDWGGKTITVAVSAKTGEGIDNLLEMILLQAEVMELKANPNRLAYGVVVESKMAKGRGPVATLLVQNGTLHLNQNIIVGNFYGKIRAMLNDHGQAVTFVTPSTPVEILGISGIPAAGEKFFAIEDEKQAKSLAQARLEKDRQQQIKTVKRVNLEGLYAQIAEGKIKDIKLIIKADVQGSLEAIKDTLNKLNVSEIKIDIIHLGVGNINSSDAILAVASDALILGFNVIVDNLAKEIISKEGIDVRTYSIIYELANDIRAAVEGMLDPKLKRVFSGRAEVRKMFKLSRSGIIAGCFVTKGKITRNSMVTLIRNGQVAFEGKLSSLKRFKDDVRDVAEGFECGIAIGGFDQLAEGDIIEAYEIEKTARKL